MADTCFSKDVAAQARLYVETLRLDGVFFCSETRTPVGFQKTKKKKNTIIVKIT